jgi:hypothetical protein
MVTVANYAVRQAADGNEFFALVLNGGVEVVRSSTGHFYATSRTTSIPSTFDEEACKKLVGTQLPGDVRRVEVEPYEYTIAETGELITLAHSYVFVPATE